MLEWPLYHYVVPFFVFYYSACLKIYFIWYEYNYTSFHSFPFCMVCLFSLLSQLPCVYPFFWIEFLAFLIHSAIQCLLISNLNTFSFKVIINMYVLILIMLIVSGCFCSSSLFLLSYRSSFMVFWLALLLCLISLLSFLFVFYYFFMCAYYEVHI